MSSDTLSLQIVEALGCANPIQSLLDFAGEQLGCTVCLMDITGKQIAKSQTPSAHTNLQRTPLYYSLHTKNVSLFYVTVNSDIPVLPETSENILAKILQALRLCCIPMEPQHCHTAAEFLFYDLLENPVRRSQSLSERCRVSAIPFQQDFQLITLCNSQNITNVPLFHMAHMMLEQLFPGSIFTIHNNRFVMLCIKKLPGRHLFENAEFMQFLNEYHMTASISLPFTNMGQLQNAYAQTLQALDEGLLLDDNTNLYLYQDYLPYHALTQIQDEHNFCHPCIYELEAYDMLHHTDCTHTLYTYIMNFRSMKDTAQQMNIHYNTLKYRIKKIEQMLDFSLEDSSQFLLLYLSFKYLRLKGKVF